MALITLCKKVYIIECTPCNKEIPSIVDAYDRGYYFLCALDDEWILPWYKSIKLNISEIYLPDSCLGIISDVLPNGNLNEIKTRTSIALPKCFPSFIDVKTEDMFPFKIRAGDVVASLCIVPLTECHVIT